MVEAYWLHCSTDCELGATGTVAPAASPSACLGWRHRIEGRDPKRRGKGQNSARRYPVGAAVSYVPSPP